MPFGTALFGVYPDEDTKRAASIAEEMNRPTGFFEAAPAAARLGFENVTWKRGYKFGEEVSALYGGAWWKDAPEADDYITDKQWRDSPWFRPNLPYRKGMTWEYARILAEDHDYKSYYSNVAGRGGFVANLAGGVAGGLPDPINFIPISGNAVASFRAAKTSFTFKKIAETTARQAAIRETGKLSLAKALGTSIADVAIPTAIVQPFYAATAPMMGEVFDQSTLMSNVIGSIQMGGAFGIGRWMFNKVPYRKLVNGLRKAAADMSSGRPVSVGPELAPEIRPGAVAEQVEIGRPVEAPQAEAAPMTRATAEPAPAPKMADVALPDVALPKELEGAKPRYGKEIIEFVSDVDKAAYIVVNQKTKSKAHDQYVNWLKESFGMTDDEIAVHGKSVKDELKAISKRGGSMVVLPIDRPSKIEVPVTVEVATARKIEVEITNPDRVKMINAAKMAGVDVLSPELRDVERAIAYVDGKWSPEATAEALKYEAASKGKGAAQPLFDDLKLKEGDPRRTRAEKIVAAFDRTDQDFSVAEPIDKEVDIKLDTDEDIIAAKQKIAEEQTKGTLPEHEAAVKKSELDTLDADNAEQHLIELAKARGISIEKELAAINVDAKKSKLYKPVIEALAGCLRG